MTDGWVQVMKDTLARDGMLSPLGFGCSSGSETVLAFGDGHPSAGTNAPRAGILGVGQIRRQIYCRGVTSRRYHEHGGWDGMVLREKRSTMEE